VPVRIQVQDFDAGAEIAALRASNPKVGAVASFIGACRDANEGDAVKTMLLEHYPGMTEKALEKIIVEAKDRWNVMEVLIVHRIGKLRPADQIVLVVVLGVHRGAAFAACEFVMDYLKTRAPFWKKEETPEGTRWVEARESDDAAAGRWEKHKADAA